MVNTIAAKSHRTRTIRMITRASATSRAVYTFPMPVTAYDATHDVSSPFDLLVRGNETGDWLGALHDFRNWLVRSVAAAAR